MNTSTTSRIWFIPIGKEHMTLEQHQKEALNKIGFNTDRPIQKKSMFFLEIQITDPNLRIEHTKPDFDKNLFKGFYCGTEIFSSYEKTAPYDRYAHFNFNADTINTLLDANSKEGKINSEDVQEQAVEAEKSPFSQSLEQALERLIFSTSNNGASRGYGKDISGIIQKLEILMNQNRQEHDEIINKNPKYLELIQLFPDWKDVNWPVQIEMF